MREVTRVKEITVDALRCPSCKSIVCSHRDVGTEHHVPRCCGMVLTVIEDWDADNGRWLIKVCMITEQEWETLGDELPL